MFAQGERLRGLVDELTGLVDENLDLAATQPVGSINGGVAEGPVWILNVVVLTEPQDRQRALPPDFAGLRCPRRGPSSATR